MSINRQAFAQTLSNATQRLLAERHRAGYWEGELSSSALSTATSVGALALVRRARRMLERHAGHQLDSLIRGGFDWLVRFQNPDGGWGDTVDSPSNVSTTVLCWAAMSFTGDDNADVTSANRAAESWINRKAGGLTAPHIARAIDRVYGKDKTFSVPILTMCALSGRLGDGRGAWTHVRALPFELAACPHALFKWLGLPVVSYALPALIAIGHARYVHCPTRNPFTRLLRTVTGGKTLGVLRAIQPQSGGYLEAVPLTGFVLMSLTSIGQGESETALAAQRFLAEAVRPDGSWPIDTNLATWVTTLAINALDRCGELARFLPPTSRELLLSYLLSQQHHNEHPYTHAAPGGWAWTHLPGGVPDADDTPGALLALNALRRAGSAGRTWEDRIVRAARSGIRWLIDLQNRDGGIPTFCRGWGKLPFDQSSPDLTAHALRAWNAWHDSLGAGLQRALVAPALRAIRFLLRTQRSDGAWVPLWFGRQQTPDLTNPLYGTARVALSSSLNSLLSRDADARDRWRRAHTRGIRWIVSRPNRDGGWGGGAGTASSVEESALAVEALAQTERPFAEGDAQLSRRIDDALAGGVDYLITHTQRGTVFDATPIGLYFARLWYSERLYPLIFTVSALHRVAGRYGLPQELY